MFASGFGLTRPAILVHRRSNRIPLLWGLSGTGFRPLALSGFTHGTIAFPNS
jgi:hypothetical protein